MKTKLIFFDIDGTLLPFGINELPKSTVRSLRKLREKGIKIFVATGKSLSQLLATKIADIQFDGYLTLNGQLCYDENLKLFFGNPIDQREMEVLEKTFVAKTIPFTLIGEFSRYINYVNDTVIFRQEETNSTIPDIGEYRGEKIYQITAYVNEKQRQLLQRVLDMCAVTSWAPDAVDIIAKGGGKLNALKRIMELYNVTKDEVMAFGDGENDFDMIKNVGIGIAMGNSVETLKEIANYITADVNDNGIEKALKYYNLID